MAREVSFWCDGFYEFCPHRKEQTEMFRRGHPLFICSGEGMFYPYLKCSHALWSYNTTPQTRRWYVPRRLRGEQKNSKVKIIKAGKVNSELL